jgi:hypothetical protein
MPRNRHGRWVGREGIIIHEHTSRPCKIKKKKLDPHRLVGLFLCFLEHSRCTVTWLVFSSSRERIARLGSEPTTTSFGFGYLCTILRWFRVISDISLGLLPIRLKCSQVDWFGVFEVDVCVKSLREKVTLWWYTIWRLSKRSASLVAHYFSTLSCLMNERYARTW